MTQDVTDRGKKLARELLVLSRKLADILPLGNLEEWYDWKIVRERILTKEKATELVRLAREIQTVRGELDRL